MLAYYVAGIAVGAIAVIYLGARILNWFYRRGRKEQKLADALDRNTTSNEKLTERMEIVAETLNDHRNRLDNHQWRIEQLEAPQHVSIHVGGAPANRNVGSA